MAINWNDNNAVMQARQKAIAAGYKAADVDEFIQKKRNENATIEIAKQGALTPEAAQVLIKDNPQLANTLAQSGLLPSQDKVKSLTEAEKKNKNLGVTGLEGLKDVQEMLEKDPTLLTKQVTPGKFQSRSFDSALFKAVNAYLRIQTGATAPEEETRRYMSALGPTFGDSPEDVAYKIDSLRSSLAREGGIEEEELNKVFPVKQKEQSSQNNMNNQQQSQNQNTEDFKGHFLFGKSPLGAMLSGRWDQIGNAINDRAQYFNDKFSTQEGQQDLVGGFTAQGAVKGAESGVSSLKNAVSLKSIGSKRDAAIQAGKDLSFSGDEIAQAGLDYLTKDPLAQRVGNKILPNIQGKQISLPDLMKFIDVWNDAYTQAGRVGKSAEAGINDVLARKAKELVAQKAPDVAGANKQFRTAYGIRDNLRKGIPTALSTIGLGALGNVIGDYIFPKN